MGEQGPSLGVIIALLCFCLLCTAGLITGLVLAFSGSEDTPPASTPGPAPSPTPGPASAQTSAPTQTSAPATTQTRSSPVPPSLSPAIQNFQNLSQAYLANFQAFSPAWKNCTASVFDPLSTILESRGAIAQQSGTPCPSGTAVVSTLGSSAWEVCGPPGMQTSIPPDTLAQLASSSCVNS